MHRYLSFAYDAVKGNHARRGWVESKQEPKTERTLEQIEGKRKKKGRHTVNADDLTHLEGI